MGDVDAVLEDEVVYLLDVTGSVPASASHVVFPVSVVMEIKARLEDAARINQGHQELVHQLRTDLDSQNQGLARGCTYCGGQADLHTQRLTGLDAGKSMDFCTYHFWTWNAKSLERRGFRVSAANLASLARRGHFGRPQPEAIPYEIVAPDMDFQEDE